MTILKIVRPLLLFVCVALCVAASAQTTITAPATTVPKGYFGMHVISVKNWPGLPIGSVSQGQTSWGQTESAKGSYNWTNLDNAVNAAKAKGVDYVYTFINTPHWASSRPSEHCYNGYTGCAAPPSSMTYFDEYVGQVVTRYKGRIKYYQVWNEPNDLAFWTGTTAQLVDMSRRANNLIKSIDPSAMILSPAPTWKPYSNAWTWLGGYFAAGGATYVDIVAYHGYTGSSVATGVFSIIDNVQKAMSSHSVNKPMWISEAGWGKNSVIPNQSDQAAFLVQRLVLTWAKNVRRFYWFESDNQGEGTLWTSGALNTPGKAYGNVAKWMTGATISTCSTSTLGTWTCKLTRANGYTAQIVWNPSTTTTVTLTSTTPFRRIRDIYGATRTTGPNAKVTINKFPLLFENFAAF